MFDFGQILNFLRFKCFDQFLFLSGVQDALPVGSSRSGECPRCSFAGAWSRVGLWATGNRTAPYLLYSTVEGVKYSIFE